MAIPTISNKRLKELYARIKPVVRYAEVGYGGKKHLEEHGEGDLYYIKEVNPRNVAFIWDPKPTTKAVGLIELDRIETLHTYGYIGFFKPSVAEVLAQIPHKYINDVVAFETKYAGESGSSHAGLTILYRQKSLNEIKTELADLQKEKETLEAKLR